MAINVYWTCTEKEWMRAEAPMPLVSHYYKNRKFDKSYPNFNPHMCPGFNTFFKNMFVLKSLYSYSFKVENGNVIAGDYNQEFFNTHVSVRHPGKKAFSFMQRFIFFTDEPSLKATLCLPPFLEDNNNIAERCIVFPGELDIGQWFRNTDMAFYLKEKYDEFVIEEGEVFNYMKFHTDEDINFIPFRFNNKLFSFLNDGANSKMNKSRPWSMEKYYSLFKGKKLILKEIKENLL